MLTNNIFVVIMSIIMCRSVGLRKTQSEQEWAKWHSLSAEEREQFHEPLQPLKLVIMSATLRVTDFQQPQLFFPLPPVIKVSCSYIMMR